MQAWYEDKTQYKWVGHVSFGNHAIYDFEVYVDLANNSIVAACHDDPDEILTLDDLIEFSDNYKDSEDAADQQALADLLSQLGVNRTV